MSVRRTSTFLLAVGLAAAVATVPAIGPAGAQPVPADAAAPALGATAALAPAATPAATPSGSRSRLAGRHSLRRAVTDENFYFVMADRFENGRTDNDRGHIAGDRDQHGFDPTANGD